MFMILLSTSLLSACSIKNSDNNNWNSIKKEHKVVIGLDATFVPMGYENQQGKITGFDVDVANAVFKQYDVKPIFQPIDWSMNVTELRNNTIDLIWNGFSINSQREKVVNFTKPYLSNDQVLVTMRDSNINSLNQMHNKTLGVQAGSSGLNELNNNPKILKDCIKNRTPVLYNSFTNAFIDLSSRRVDGLLIDSTYANYYVRHQKNPKAFAIKHTNFPKEYFAVGARKGDYEITSAINKGLDKISKNGELKKICQKWFGKEYESPLLNKQEE
ncbi:amino acid ABC transporter substrate-binding protein [Apilactobacillus ozensis]|uniref:amino acid ABC transporter substrate-binding protein n=1 Tax=Apilactobacillus ozensis TaxID=866801 RepID=UPI00200B1928|nr:amino acid ABC transporter substrate-binding protein [Apilactobacillus ozensis]MCK8607352.1 amino acid ABC transporter substrate-binding protein [Apilactobacillus ozensis]